MGFVELFSSESLLMRHTHTWKFRSIYQDCEKFHFNGNSTASIIFYHFEVHFRTLHFEFGVEMSCQSLQQFVSETKKNKYLMSWKHAKKWKLEGYNPNRWWESDYEFQFQCYDCYDIPNKHEPKLMYFIHINRPRNFITYSENGKTYSITSLI